MWDFSFKEDLGGTKRHGDCTISCILSENIWNRPQTANIVRRRWQKTRLGWLLCSEGRVEGTRQKSSQLIMGSWDRVALSRSPPRGPAGRTVLARRAGRPYRSALLWTRSGILKKKRFSKKIITPLPRQRPDFRGGGYLTEFSISIGFFGLAGLAGGVHN